MCRRDVGERIRREGRDEDFFFQAEDGIRDFCLSRGLGDVYKKQDHEDAVLINTCTHIASNRTTKDNVADRYL